MILIKAFEKSNKKRKVEELSFNLAIHENNVSFISEAKKLKCNASTIHFIFVLFLGCVIDEIFPSKHVSKVYCFLNQKENRKPLIIFAIRRKRQLNLKPTIDRALI